MTHLASLSVQDMVSGGRPGASVLRLWLLPAVMGSVPSPPSTFTLR